jgi:hypothetical protein
VRGIAISGLVALAAVLGGVAVPAAALAQPTAAVRAGGVVTMGPGRAALASGGVGAGEAMISCALATDCLGIEGSSSIGTGGPSTPTRAERWNGSSWQDVGVALPKGARADDLNGVSCRGGRSCLVVGDYYTATSQSAASRALALSYNGTSLKPTPAVPLPKGTTDAAFSGVSCATARYCVALGTADGDTAAFGQAGSLIIIETWNGAAWTLHTAPAVLGKTAALELSGVSCATPVFCVLAGDTVTITPDSGTTGIYLASWNGKKLTAMKPATASGGKGLLIPAAVSCATASNCAVTGAEQGAGIESTATAATQIWNGKTWRLDTVAWPKGIRLSFMLGVSCYGAHSCEAVGLDGANPGTSSFAAAAVSYNGTAGTVQAVPAPPKGYSDEFGPVSCAPRGGCVAIGQTGKATASSHALMTGVWNGKTWKLDRGF